MAAGGRKDPEASPHGKADRHRPHPMEEGAHAFNRLALCIALSHDRIQPTAVPVMVDKHSQAWAQPNRERLAFRLHLQFKGPNHPKAMKPSPPRSGSVR